MSLDHALDFSGKVVVVTGGARGIGRGITERFLEAGADVVICGRNVPDDLPAAGGRTAVFVAADVREPDDVDRVVTETVTRFGRLDVLVNNAGGGPPADSATASPRFSTSIITLNLIAPLVFAQRANAVMQAQEAGGVIINIASVSGIRPSPGSAAYGAAKAGLLNLTETLAVDYAPKVRVVAVTVGLRPHRAVAPLLRRRGRHRRGRRTIPVGRMADPVRHRRRLPVPRVAARPLRERHRASSPTVAARTPPTSTAPPATSRADRTHRPHGALRDVRGCAASTAAAP